MNVKELSYKELEKAIYVSFNGDINIFEMYDPTVSVSSIEEIVSDIIGKIKDYGEVLKYGIYEKGTLIGYIVKKQSMLISFGLAIKYRVYDYLQDFFEYIKLLVGQYFSVVLWQRNVRAIKFLIKKGLVITFSDNNIIKLQCQ